MMCPNRRNIILMKQLGSLRDDYVYWLKILKEVPYAYGNLTVTISYRDRVTAVTSNKIRMNKASVAGTSKSRKIIINKKFVLFSLLGNSRGRKRKIVL